MSAPARLKAAYDGGPLRVLSASGQLGLGLPEAAFRRGLEARPHVIAADMGSVDPGPAYLGSGRMAAPAQLMERDLALVLEGACALSVPLVIGSAGTAGAAPHVDAVVATVRTIAEQRGLSFRLGVIRSDIAPQMVAQAQRAGRLFPIGEMELTADTLAATATVVAQAGIAPFVTALEAGADVIIAGRACDTAPFAVVPIMLGFPHGPAMHMAKIIECASICCEPGGRDAILATLNGDAFTLESMNEARAATPLSVAAHALYEQADPYAFHEPAGTVRLDAVTYEAVDARRVRVRGATWHPARRPTVKIEGARKLGHRAVMLAAAADPQFVAQVDTILPAVESAVRDMVPGDWLLSVRRYGIDGVTDWPGPPDAQPREIFLLGECVADDGQTARAALVALRQRLLHFGFEGRLSTGGNLAFPIAPPEFDGGEAYEFSIYHVMEIESWEALANLFPVSLEAIGVSE